MVSECLSHTSSSDRERNEAYWLKIEGTAKNTGFGEEREGIENQLNRQLSNIKEQVSEEQD